MDGCREPRIDAMSDIIGDWYTLYKDAGQTCDHIENAPEGSGCGSYDSCDNTKLEVITKKFKAQMKVTFANAPDKQKAAVSYWSFLIKSFDKLYGQDMKCIDKSGKVSKFVKDNDLFRDKKKSSQNLIFDTSA